jgi:hypothetical protein
VGSVAHYYQEILEEAIEICNMRLGNIMQVPMDGLVKYHA